jgi:hypothetical protein
MARYRSKSPAVTCTPSSENQTGPPGAWWASQAKIQLLSADMIAPITNAQPIGALAASQPPSATPNMDESSATAPSATAIDSRL